MVENSAAAHIWRGKSVVLFSFLGVNPNRIAATVNVAVAAIAEIHHRQPLAKRQRDRELRLDDHLALCVDVSPDELDRIFVVLRYDRRSTIGEVVTALELIGNDKVSFSIDISRFQVGSYDAGQAVAETAGAGKLRFDRPVAGFVQIAPLSGRLGGRQTAREVTDAFVLRRDDERAGSIDESPFAVGFRRGETFPEWARVLKLRGDDDLAGFFVSAYVSVIKHSSSEAVVTCELSFIARAPVDGSKVHSIARHPDLRCASVRLEG